MKNFRKKMSWLGLSMALTMPIGALLACRGGGEEDNFELPDISNAQAINFDLPDLEAFKTAAISYGIKKQEVDSITNEDVQQYRTNDKKLSSLKKGIIKKIDNFFTLFLFKNNTNKKVMEELQKWINNANLSILNSQSSGRGPWRSNEDFGVLKYYRSKLVNIRSSIKNGGLDLVGTNFVSGASFNQDRILRDFNTTSSTKKGERPFDNHIAKGNAMVGGKSSGASFSIFRTRASGKFDYDVNQDTGLKTWKSEVKETTKLFGGLDIEINGKAPTNRTYEEIKKLAKSEGPSSQIVFSNSETPVKYGIAKNGNAIDSNVNFKAKDLFYGLVRSFYASKEFRNEGKIEGLDLNRYAKKLTSNQKAEWTKLFTNEDSANAFNNGNMYLYNLYGVDLEETMRLNLESNDDDKFIVKFKSFTETSLGLFRDSTAVTPFPKSELANPNGNNLDADILKVFTYGNPYSGTGKVKTDGIHTLSPFIYTSYSTSSREFQIVKQNPVYFDQDWVNDNLSVKGFIRENKQENIDSSSYAQARINAFKDAERTGEYILDLDVYNQKTLLKQVKDYKVYLKPTRSGVSGPSRMSWNFYGFGDESHNNFGKKMLWGFDSNEDIKTNPESMRNFFSGVGAKTRASINAAINWQAMAQTLFPGQNKEFYPGIALDNDFVISKVDPSKAYPSYLSKIDDMKEIYNLNLENKFKAWTPSTVAIAAKTLDDIATSVGATKDNPARIGVFKYIWLKDKASEQVIETNKIILKRLNALTPKVKFRNQKDYSWDDFVTYAWKKKTAATQLGGFGPDYLGLGSINQQFLTKYASFGIIGFFKDAFAV